MALLDNASKPGRHADDRYVDTITPTSNGIIAFTRNGVTVNERATGKGLIKAAGHADNYVGLKDGVKSGQTVMIQETGETKNTPLFVRNASDSMVAVVGPGKTCELKWFWTSSSAGSWIPTAPEFGPTKTYLFEELPTICENDGTAAVTTDAKINVHNYPDGLQLHMRNEQAQSIFGPVANASGMDYACDQAEDDGYDLTMANETTGGIIGKSAFTAQGPAFFASLKFSVANASGADLFGFGLRKTEAQVDGAAFTAYDTYGAIGWNETAASPNIDLFAEVNGANASATDSTIDFADTNTKTFMVKVSDAGVISWFIDGTEYDGTSTAAYKTFDDGDIVTPFFSVLQAATAQSGSIVLQELKVGYQ